MNSLLQTAAQTLTFSFCVFQAESCTKHKRRCEKVEATCVPTSSGTTLEHSRPSPLSLILSVLQGDTHIRETQQSDFSEEPQSQFHFTNFTLFSSGLPDPAVLTETEKKCWGNGLPERCKLSESTKPANSPRLTIRGKGSLGVFFI